MSLLLEFLNWFYSILNWFCLGFTAVVLTGALVIVAVNPKLCLLIVKNLRRNVLRTALTSVAIMVLVLMVSMIWTVVSFIDQTMEEQTSGIKLIVTDKYLLPSQLPATHGDSLDPRKSTQLEGLKGLYGRDDFMTWSFYGGSITKESRDRDEMVFMFVMEPDQIKPMMDDLDKLPDSVIAQLKADPRNVLLGAERMQKIKRGGGDTFKLYSLNYKGIDLEFKIVGELPGSRYNLSGIMQAEYFNRELDAWPNNANNIKKQPHHDLDRKRLNLIWIRAADKDTAAKITEVIQSAKEFKDRPVKCETASSLISSFLDSFRDILAAIKFLVVPAILASMALVVANAIAITVRERRAEMAVLKVLGFRPTQIQILVLGEAVLVGGLSGLAGTAVAFAVINWVYGGISFQIGFFPAFPMPWWALFWGTAMGSGTALLGSFLPSWTARSVKVSEVFSKVA